MFLWHGGGSKEYRNYCSSLSDAPILPHIGLSQRLLHHVITTIKQGIVEENKKTQTGECLRHKETKMKIAIVGGGISGLTCAFWLKNLDIRSLFFEKKSHLGGWIQSTKTPLGSIVDVAANGWLG